jgi:tetratricopeptide (TPR) repeat protein
MPLEPLNIAEQDPSHYEGSFVALDDVQYVVGPRIGHGEEHLVHVLINPRSHCGFFLIKIPTTPWVASKYNPKLLRMMNLLDAPVAQTAVVAIPGGACQIQRYIGPYTTDRRISDAMQAADRAGKDGRLAEAMALYDQLLAQHPDLSVALHNLAVAKLKADREAEALRLLYRANRLEPHHPRFTVTFFTVCMNTGQYRAGLAASKRVTTLFSDFRLDQLAAEAFLEIGAPEDALALARTGLDVLDGRSGPQAEFYQALERTAQEHLDAKQRAWRLYETSDTDEPSWSRVKRAHESYPPDPVLATNCGFALRSAEKYSEAKEVLARASLTIDESWRAACLLNASFSALLAGDNDDAAVLVTELLATPEVREAQSPYELPELAGALHGDLLSSAVPGTTRMKLLEHFGAMGLDEAHVPEPARRLLSMYSRFPS